MNEEDQRQQIQIEVNQFFGRQIHIRPRAMAALQGRWVEDWTEHGFEDVVEALSVFEELLSVSPHALTSLFEVGIPIEKLMSKNKKQGIGFLPRITLENIFQGFSADEDLSEICPAGKVVQTSGKLDEILLLQAFLQTAYTGPITFSRIINPYDLWAHTTDVGECLINAGFIDVDSKEEFWDGEPDSYQAKSLAAEKFIETAKQVNKVRIADPSHDLYQYSLWLDPNNKIRVRPFGVGNLGHPIPEYLYEGSSLIFREGIFQPKVGFSNSITQDVLSVFEEMINSKSCSEIEFQRFFEKYPELLIGLDYKQAHSQLVLFNEDGPNLIPDFMLEPMSSKFCDLLELKVPYVELVRRLQRGSRTRFTAFISEAISQLVEYRRFFDNKSNRKSFHERYGLEAYYPKMVLVVGRRHNFKDDAERQELNSLLPKDLSFWTYDDLLDRARNYQSIMKNS